MIYVLLIALLVPYVWREFRRAARDRRSARKLGRWVRSEVDH